MTEVEVSTCHSAKCGAQFVTGSGIVPDLVALYEQVRGAKVEPTYPLTRAEVLSMEFCRNCGRDRLFEKFGIKTFSTDGALGIMEQWAEKNARELSKRQESQASWEQRERARLLEMASKRPDNRGFVNQTFAEAKPRKEHIKRGKRHANAGKPKHEEVVESKPSKKKSKGGGKNKGGKGKGGKGKGR